MYAAAFIGDKIIDLAGWDQGARAETSNLSISYSNSFQQTAYIGATYGRQFSRPGTMASASFNSQFELLDLSSGQYQRWITYFMYSLPKKLSNQNGCVVKILQPWPGYGVKQVEKATGIGTITSSGTDKLAKITIASVDLDWSPIEIHFPVFNGETSDVWMNRGMVYCRDTPQIANFFVVSGTGSDIILTRRSPFSSNDISLNIAIDNVTSTGITPSLVSTNVTSGVPIIGMNEMIFYDANVSVSTTQIGTSVMLNTAVTGRLVNT